MERLWEAHRSSCESAVARHVPQALGALSLSLEGCSSPQTGALAQPAAPRGGETVRGRLPQSQRTLGSESGVKRTCLAEARTRPKSISRGDGSSADRLDLGDGTACGFVWRNAIQ